MGDRAVDRPERARGEDRAGDDHPSRSLTIDNQPGAGGEDQRLEQLAEGLREGAHGGEAFARRIVHFGVGFAQPFPPAFDLATHAEGADHLRVAAAGFEEAGALRPAAGALLDLRRGHPVGP